MNSCADHSSPTHPPALDLEEVHCLLCGSAAADVVALSEAQQHVAREPFQFVQCRECTLVRLSPRVRAPDIGRYYDETYLPHRGAAAWGRYAPIVEKTLTRMDRVRVGRVLALGPLHASSRVLDFGCGRPTFLEAMHRATGAHCVGVDISGEGWSRDGDRWAQLELHEGTLDAAPLRGGFDAITLWHALEHEYDPLATLRRLRALANPGAVLVVEVPNYDTALRRWHGGHWAGFHTPRHSVAFSPRTLAALVQAAGWTVERQLRHGTIDPYVTWWLGRQDALGRSIRGDLSGSFLPYLLGKLAALALTPFQRWISLGPQTLFARA